MLREKASRLSGESVPAPRAFCYLPLGAEPPRARGWRERPGLTWTVRRLRADRASAGHALFGSPGTGYTASGRARSWRAPVAQPGRQPSLVGPQTAPPPGVQAGVAPRKHRRGAEWKGTDQSPEDTEVPPKSVSRKKAGPLQAPFDFSVESQTSAPRVCRAPIAAPFKPAPAEDEWAGGHLCSPTFSTSPPILPQLVPSRTTRQALLHLGFSDL